MILLLPGGQVGGCGFHNPWQLQVLEPGPNKLYRPLHPKETVVLAK